MKKKTMLLLIVIYIAFIALGLPDALLGSAWNLVREDLSVSLGTLGIMTFIVYVMSVAATYNAPRILKVMQTKWVVGVSILMTGTALLSISMVGAFWHMLFFALPLGAGAGAIDVSLNHYLAINHKARHMNLLHSFYGIGVTSGPAIMALALGQGKWRSGYLAVGIILLAIALVVFLSFPLWKDEHEDERNSHHAHVPLGTIIGTKGVMNAVLIFTTYVHLESLAGVWIASYIYIEKGLGYAGSALFATLYYLGLTLGRIISGIIGDRLSARSFVIAGESMVLTGIVLLFLETQSIVPYVIAVGLIGLGSGPVFPNMMMANTDLFEKKVLSRVISLEMAVGYLGFGILTPLAGLVFDRAGIWLYPYVMAVAGIVMFLLSIRLLARPDTPLIRKET